MKRVRWEYKMTGAEEDLSILGEEGWELVSVIVVDGKEKRYFKRPAPSLSEQLTLTQREAALQAKERDNA